MWIEKERYLSLEDLPNEEWRDVVGWEGAFCVSNMGRVKSMQRNRVSRWENSPFLTKERILSPRVCGTQREYLAVSLNHNGRHKQYKIHRLVAEAFIPNPMDYKEINHINEIKGDNRASNLEWCSRSYNVGYGSGKFKRALKVVKPVLMLNDEHVVIKEFTSIREAAEYVGIDASNVSRGCSLGRKSGGYYWKIKEE